MERGRIPSGAVASDGGRYGGAVGGRSESSSVCCPALPWWSMSEVAMVAGSSLPVPVGSGNMLTAEVLRSTAGSQKSACQTTKEIVILLDHKTTKRDVCLNSNGRQRSWRRNHSHFCAGTEG